MTIIEAVKTVMAKKRSPMTAHEIYDEIIKARLYTFHSLNPVQMVNSQIRRHCEGIDFPTSSKTKHFKLVGGRKYSLLSEHLKTPISDDQSKRSSAKAGRHEQHIVFEKDDQSTDQFRYAKPHSLRGGSRPLNEAKLILVGRGGVGKTSIVNRLVHNTFKDEKKTEGIKITELLLRLRNKEQVRLNVWDFGGQEIMHATYQFFLTARSLYLLVLDGREGGEDTDAEYWLKLIQSFGGDSPVVIVLNKIEERPFDVNRSALQQKYPFIRDFVRTDCKVNVGIAELRRVVERETDQLEHLRDAFPAAWFEIKDKLAGMKKNYLSFDEYRRECARLGEEDPQAQESLALYLHSLGIALNYRDDPRLKDTHVLNPHWVTSGIYKILNSQKLERQKGEMHLSDLPGILDKTKYPATMHRFLLDLMKKFELCFSFPGEETYYLIPELLDKQEPKEARDFKPEECLNFQYHYPVLPEGLLPRFIVRTHVLSDEMPRWRTGVVLKLEDNLALVKADVPDRRVFISVQGPVAGRRRLLSIIRANFDQIHGDIRRLQPAEIVPLPGYPNAVIPYQELTVMEQRGIRTFPKVVGGNVVELDVHDLLNGVDLEGTRRAGRAGDERRSAVRLFCSYSHKDERLLNELKTHLSPLRRMRLIEAWDDREIEASEDWMEKVNENLERADIILLLVSANFVASDYSYEKEMRRALELHKQKKARVMPIIVRDVNWRNAPFGNLRAIPRDGRPITMWQNKDTAWRAVSEEIQRVAEQILLGEDEIAREALLISKISLKNIRCFEHLILDLSLDGEIRKFILLFGDNGVGKTTLLRSIAIGLCDETTAAALMEMLPSPLLRESAEEGSISVELSTSGNNKTWIVETVLRRNQEGTVVIEQNSPGDFPRDRLFVCGYGAGRRGFGTQDYASYAAKNSLGTLFNYDTSLQNPELAFRRMEAQSININELTRSIDAVLLLEPGSTSIDNSGISIKGPWGEFMPLGGLGDGFQATLGWMADLFGWALFYEPESLMNGISGVVLLDEVEQHLHPSWQREVVKLLHEQFPGIQFIGTSHSPMCALGTTALSESATEIFRLRQMDSCVEATPLAIPKGQRADQVLTSSLFGLFSASGFDVSADIELYAHLASKKDRSDMEEEEFNNLGVRLEAILGPFRSDLERRIDEVVRNTMQQELEVTLRSGQLTGKALDLQIRHRIQKFFGQGAME